MAEEPEQVLPQDGAAAGWVEHVRAEDPVGQQAEQRGGQTGKAISTRMLVNRMLQVKMGIRHMAMPGARRHTIVVTMFTVPRMVPSPLTIWPTAHRLAPTLGEYAAAGQSVA